MGGRIGDSLIWMRCMREALRSLGRCLRCHKLKGKAQTAVPGLYSLFLVQPTGSELGSHQQWGSSVCVTFRELFPRHFRVQLHKPGLLRPERGRVCGKASMAEVPDNRSRKEMSHSTFLLWLHRPCKIDEEAPKPNKILPQWVTCVVLSTSWYPLGVYFSKTQITPLTRGMRLHLTLSGV